jgi:acyl-CoA reductase-like NAD-dependent aldehyde dehydrogenase
MRRFPYPTEALTGFEAMEADALLLERLAEEMEQSKAALHQLGALPEVTKALENRLKRLRRIAACLGYMAGRLDRLHLLNEPVRRESNYGGNHRSAA